MNMVPRFKNYASAEEAANRSNIIELFRDSPIPEGELLSNLGLFINRQNLSRLLFLNELYRKIIPVHGIIMEFGVRWGQNLALFESLRGMYEPFNHNRKIVGFDTFAGFPALHAKDGTSDIAVEGAYSVTDGYQSYLEQVLDYHEGESPISHLRKYQLVAGDACETIAEYLREFPETIVAFAYFDFDIYEPTKICLEAIRPHLTKGSVIGFDELNVHDFPGETIAVKEVLGLTNFRVQRSPLSSVQSFIVVE